MKNATDCIQAVKIFEENVKDKAVIERIAEKITQKCYESALEGYTSVTIQSNNFISIVQESQGIAAPKSLNTIIKLVEEEICKYGFYVYQNEMGLYISWKENKKNANKKTTVTKTK